MGKLIMWNLLTADGYFEGAHSWDLDWHQCALDDNFFSFALEQLQSANLLVFGRKTYEGMAGYWPHATGTIAELMNELPKLVFSRTLERVEWVNSQLATRDLIATILDLKNQLERNILIFGSANLSSTLINAGLFDEYRLGMTSVILGTGRRLFREGMKRTELTLLESRQLSPGLTVLRYKPAVST